MALPETHLRQISRWCRERCPESARHRGSFDADVDGSSVTIMERFLQVWDPARATEWTNRPLAQLRFDGAAWRLFYPDRDFRWHLAPDVEAEFSPGPLLKAIDDPRNPF